MSRYWIYRIDKSIPWSSGFDNNIAIHVTSVMENDYLKIEKVIDEYNYLIGQTDC